MKTHKGWALLTKTYIFQDQGYQRMKMKNENTQGVGITNKNLYFPRPRLSKDENEK
jgi:hypothetical protein